MLSAIHGFNTGVAYISLHLLCTVWFWCMFLSSTLHGLVSGIPYVQKHVKGPKWLPFVIGV